MSQENLTNILEKLTDIFKIDFFGVNTLIELIKNICEFIELFLKKESDNATILLIDKILTYFPKLAIFIFVFIIPLSLASPILFLLSSYIWLNRYIDNNYTFTKGIRKIMNFIVKYGAITAILYLVYMNILFPFFSHDISVNWWVILLPCIYLIIRSIFLYKVITVDTDTIQLVTLYAIILSSMIYIVSKLVVFGSYSEYNRQYKNEHGKKPPEYTGKYGLYAEYNILYSYYLLMIIPIITQFFLFYKYSDYKTVFLILLSILLVFHGGYSFYNAIISFGSVNTIRNMQQTENNIE